jgi:Skp family chaperone for outer membrane proteins
MTFKPFVAATCAAVALSTGSAAFAQQPAAAAAPAVTHGPAVNGVCVLSVEGVIGGSTVGKYIDTRMQQLVAQVNAELNGERTAIENEGKTLDAQKATMDRGTLEQRAATLQVRVNTLQRKAQQREREISATEQKAVGRVGTEMEPIIRQVYQQRACSLLVNRQAVVIANPAMDITPAVVAGLNAKITQFAFERERLDQQATPAQGGVARPPAAATTPAPATRR